MTSKTKTTDAGAQAELFEAPDAAVAGAAKRTATGKAAGSKTKTRRAPGTSAKKKTDDAEAVPAAPRKTHSKRASMNEAGTEAPAKRARTAKAKKGAGEGITEPASAEFVAKASDAVTVKKAPARKNAGAGPESGKKKASRAKKGSVAASAAGKTLVIVESPTKAKTLTKMLGNSYVVKASVGHIRDLPKSRLGIDVENDFAPEYILVKGKAPIKAELLSAAKKASSVLLASDPDREGEAIAWHIATLLGIDPASDCRVKFHEITKDAVLSAVNDPSPIDMTLVNAQQARRLLDRLAGYYMSPLLWKKIRRGLSAGRVQSVALSLLCAREDEIEAFIPKDYWNVFVDARSGDGRGYRLHLERENGKSLLTEGKTLAIDTQEKVDEIVRTLRSEPLTVAAYSEKKNRRKQPAPFKTSTLQQMAASRLGLSPRRTMSVAQSLFEGVSIPGHGTVGLITYMRTDSLRMAPEAIAQARQTINDTWGEKYLPAKPVVYQAGAGAQDAHEAIRPTNFAFAPDAIKDSLSPEQYRLYDMIWRRSIASQMAPAVVNLSSIDCNCGRYGLRAQGSSINFPGWGAAWPLDVKDTMLAPAVVGERLAAEKIDPQKEQTKPPSRYTESSLIKTLEDDGIGRPSTYASIVETLYDRKYVVRDEEQGRKLKPTNLGRKVNEFLLRYFDSKSPSPIVDVNFTSSMETDLDRVENGGINWKDLLRKFWSPFTEAVSVAEKSEHVEMPGPEPTGEMCPECGQPLVKRTGRYGEFIGCSGFPACHYIKPVLRTIGMACPKCGATDGGEVVRRRSRKGRSFYSCSRYPDCDYISWSNPKTDKKQ